MKLNFSNIQTNFNYNKKFIQDTNRKHNINYMKKVRDIIKNKVN